MYFIILRKIFETAVIVNMFLTVEFVQFITDKSVYQFISCTQVYKDN